MGLTHFPNGIFATPNLGGGIVTQGNIWFVKPYSGSDSNSGTSPDTAFKTLAGALSAATANQNDIVYFCQENNTASETTDYQSVNLNWNKDGVHLIGIPASQSGLYIGQRARVAPSSSANAFANLFTLSANNCMISGIEFFQGVGATTLSAAQTCLTVSGTRNSITNCQISGIGDTTCDYAGSNSLTVAADENYFGNCYIGLDTVIRATSVTEVIIGPTQLVGTRNIFDKCIINSYTSGTTFKAMSFTAGSYHTATWLNNCMITNALNRTSVVTTTGAITAPTSGTVYINGGGVFGYSNITTANSSNVYVSAPILSTGVKQGLAGPVTIA